MTAPASKFSVDPLEDTVTVNSPAEPSTPVISVPVRMSTSSLDVTASIISAIASEASRK
jgi:hypothetical protein